MLTLLAASALANTPTLLSQTVDPARVEADVRMLSGDEPLPDGTVLESRHIEHPDHAVAATWLEGRLAELPGFTVRSEPFVHDDLGLDNLIAELPGQDPGAPWVVLGAHFDSTASAEQSWIPDLDPAPGADDDASGVAALLEAGRVLGEHGHFEHGIRIVLFDAEEVGLVGSEHHVGELTDDTEVALIFDPVGYNPGGAGYLWFSYEERWPGEKELADATGTELGLPIQLTGVDQASIGGDQRSDHAPFWADGRPALHFGSFPQPPAYHTPDDTVEVVDFAFLGEVTRFASGHVASRAGVLEKRGCGCDGGGGPVGWWLVALAGLWIRPARRSRCR